MAISDTARISNAPLPAAFPERSVFRDMASCSLCAFIRAAELAADCDLGALVPEADARLEYPCLRLRDEL